jgi:DNA-binding transcriptional MerR regulator
MMAARFLTASDAARILDLTPGAIRQMHKRGELAVAEQTAGGVNLFLRDEVERVAAVRRLRSADSSPANRATSRRERGQR